MSDNYDYAADILVEVHEHINEVIEAGDWTINWDNRDPTTTMNTIEEYLTSRGWELNHTTMKWTKVSE